ncbi:MAG: type VI secretion system baseplate subunit TssF [Verrucomicrobiales bacterium]|nr:type VI secretion system baseplate subunit TssF [Verrucomicrobiales bacterium]
MERRLIEIYEDELRFIRHCAGEFAAERPDIARRLDLKADGLWSDPYVERLLEGFAFLTARTQRKLEAEFPAFTQSLLETTYPQYNCPFPSCAILEMTPMAAEASLKEGRVVERDSSYRTVRVGDNQTECLFTTAAPMTLWPIRIESATYYGWDVGRLRLPPELGAKAAIVLRLKTLNGTFKEIGADRLTVYLAGLGESSLPAKLYGTLMAHAQGIVLQAPIVPGKEPERYTVVPAPGVHPFGFEPEQRILPIRAECFDGYRLLREYFSFPQKFMFAELTGLKPGFAKCKSQELDLIIPLSARDETLEQQVDRRYFRLFCVPAVNLFRLDSDHITLDDRVHEYHVVPDRMRPLDYEVYQIESVLGLPRRSGKTQEFHPFFFSPGESRDAFYSLRREPRSWSSGHAIQDVSYEGSEVYVMLSDTAHPPFDPDLSRLAVSALCTNRHLPVFVPRGEGAPELRAEIPIPTSRVAFLVGPTDPRPAPAPGSLLWRTIGHLAVNFFSLVGKPDTGTTQDARVLREILKIYGEIAGDQREIPQRIMALRGVGVETVTQRIPSAGPVAFARGLRITLEIEEAPFEILGAHLFGAVLERFLSRLVSINCFTETVLRASKPTEREIMRWKPRLGTRFLL